MDLKAVMTLTRPKATQKTKLTTEFRLALSNVLSAGAVRHSASDVALRVGEPEDDQNGEICRDRCAQRARAAQRACLEEGGDEEECQRQGMQALDTCIENRCEADEAENDVAIALIAVPSRARKSS